MAPTISRLSALHLKQRANAPKAISGRTAGNWPLQTDDNVGARRPVANAKRGRPIHMLLRRVAGGAEFHGKVQAARIVAENKPLV